MDWHAGSDLDRITYRLVVAQLFFFGFFFLFFFNLGIINEPLFPRENVSCLLCLWISTCALFLQFLDVGVHIFLRWGLCHPG